jgi:Leucine-rich repeat (LRR) protein
MPTQINATILPTVLVHDASQDSTAKADKKLIHNPHSPGDNGGIRKNLGTTQQKASNSAVKLSNEESDNDSAFQMESGKPQRSQSWFGSSSGRLKLGPRRSKSSNPRDEHITVPDGNDDEESASSKPRHRHRKRNPRAFCMCLALFLMALIGITAGIALGVFFRQQSRDAPDKDPAAGDVRPPVLTTGSPSLRPSSANEPTASPIDFQDLYQRLCASLADCRTLLVEESPQGQAFHWLSGTADYPLIQDDKLLSRFALATFYFATKGPEWNQQEGWLSDQDECVWFSSSLSSCDGEDTFTALELDNNNVEGSIPTEIGLLTALTSISLRNPAESRPFIGGAIPSSLGMLSSLESLRLSGNQLSGFLPFELGKLSRLRLIDVGHNVLKGGIPFTFDGLVALEHLDVQHNALTGALPERFLTNALSLKEMILDDNMFSSLSAKTGTLRNLRRLSAANNDLATFPSSLLELYELVQLDLSGNGLDGTIPATIGSMQGLQELRLSSNRLGGTLPRSLGTLLNLNEVLDLSSNHLTGSIPVEVSNLGQLKKLYLNSNQLGGSIPSELVRLNQITVLRLDDNALTGQVPILLCDLYDFTRALTYADCGEIGGGDACFTYCCAAETGCRCRFESSSSSPTTGSTNDFLRCVAS